MHGFVSHELMKIQNSQIIKDNRKRLLSVPPLIYLSLAFCTGIAFAYKIEVSFELISFAVAFLFMIYILTRFRGNIIFRVLLFFSLGMLFGIDSRNVSNSHVVRTHFEGKTTIEGVVVDDPEIVTRGKKETVSFVLKLDSFYEQGEIHRASGNIRVVLFNPRREIGFGERVRLRGMLEKPKRSTNFHAFDYSGYLAKRGIYRIFQGIGQYSVLKQIKEPGVSWLLTIHKLRVNAKKQLDRLLEKPYSDLAAGLLLGFRKNIPRHITDEFIKTGTAHFLSISGLHISLLGGFFYLLGRFFRIPRKLNLFLTMGLILLYCVMAGAAIPVLRSGIMGVMVLAGFLLGHERNLGQAFFFSFLLLLVWDPASLFDVSFQLSFISVAALVFIFPKIDIFLGNPPQIKNNIDFLARVRYEIRSTIQASLAVMIAIFPVLIWYFHLFSLIGFIANMFVIPVGNTAIITTLFLMVIALTSQPVAAFFVFVQEALFKCLCMIVHVLSQVPFGYFYLPVPHWSFFIVYYSILLLWFSSWFVPVYRSVRFGLIGGLVGITFLYFIFSSPRTFRFVVFDVGKTDAAFVQFSSRSNCLINSGRSFPGDQAYWTIQPFLSASGVQIINGILFSVVDGKHSGGLQTLAKYFRIQNIWYPRDTAPDKKIKYIDALSGPRIKKLPVAEGERLGFGETEGIEFIESGLRKGNVFHIFDGAVKILYLNSVLPEVFSSLIEIYKQKCQVLILPDHPNGISAEERSFLEAVSPQYIVLNQREGILSLRQDLKKVTKAVLLFIAETGAIEFYREGTDLLYKTVVDSSQKG